MFSSINNSLSKDYFGFQCLKQLPKERLFQFFIDGRFHKLKNGLQYFASREPGCVEAFSKPLNLL